MNSKVDVLDQGDEHWVGGEDAGCCYQAELTTAGWMVRVWVVAEHFTDDLLTDGPYESMRVAELAGHNAGADWCITNQVPWCDDEDHGEDR